MCPIPKSSIYKLWSCSCYEMANSSSAKYGVLSMSVQSAQFLNPVYINCGHVVALGRQIFHLLNFVRLACLPKVPNFERKQKKKKKSIYKLWSCDCGHVVALGHQTNHLLNMVCLAYLPKVLNSQIQYI